MATLFASSCSDLPPNSPIGSANGTFENSCCGTITLLNGRMTVSGQQIEYVVDQDKLGTFVLTDFYVGPSSKGFVVRRDQNPLKMRMDSNAQPSEIQLISNQAGEGVFTFRRLGGR